MYLFLLSLHSVFRWLVVASLVYAIFRAGRGYISGKAFSKTDDSIRHWTATISHIQLMLGIILLTQSPVVKAYFSNPSVPGNFELVFYSIVHPLMMLVSIVFVTIGSAMAKRKKTGKEKFRTMLVLFLAALVIIFVAIPWPFSPLAARPYIRPF